MRAGLGGFWAVARRAGRRGHSIGLTDSVDAKDGARNGPGGRSRVAAVCARRYLLSGNDVTFTARTQLQQPFLRKRIACISRGVLGPSTDHGTMLRPLTRLGAAMLLVLLLPTATGLEVKLPAHDEVFVCVLKNH